MKQCVQRALQKNQTLCSSTATERPAVTSVSSMFAFFKSAACGAGEGKGEQVAWGGVGWGGGKYSDFT